MKKFIATILLVAIVAIASLTANAQNTFPEYPAEWGTLKDFYEIPVPSGPGYECEKYLLGRTQEGGTIFAGPGKLCHYDQTFTGAYFSFNGEEWMFTPAYVNITPVKIIWSSENVGERSLRFAVIGKHLNDPFEKHKEKYQIVFDYADAVRKRAWQDPEAENILH